MTAVTVVCCSMISLIQMRYGSAELRQGRSRAWRADQAVRVRRERARVAGSHWACKTGQTRIVQKHGREAKGQDAWVKRATNFMLVVSGSRIKSTPGCLETRAIFDLASQPFCRMTH